MKKYNKIEKNLLSFLKISLVVMITMTITACSTNQIKKNDNFLKPTTPQLDFQRNEQGGICLDRENLSMLNEYIIELERIYN